MQIYDHGKYSRRSDEDLRIRAWAKEKELELVISKIKLPVWVNPKVAVLGCPDGRMVSDYMMTFRKYIGRPVELVILDKTIKHLAEFPNAVEHDAVNPLPNPPYNLVYSHVLLKFAETEDQWRILKNSHDALTDDGIAVHIFDREEVIAKGPKLPDGWNSVPLARWKDQLAKDGIKFLDVTFNFDQAIEGMVPNSIRGVKGTALVLFKNYENSASS